METAAENSITTFAYAGKDPVRTSVVEGKIWFVAKDVCKILGIARYHEVSRHLDAEERGMVVVPTLGGRQSMVAVSESGLFTLMIRSRKPQAKALQAWVTDTVLPGLRRTGTYTVPAAVKQPDLPEIPKSVYGVLRGLLDDLERQDKTLVAVTSRVEHLEHGVPMLPVPENASQEFVTPTQIGRMRNPRLSGMQTNRLLREAGLQYRVGEEWVPSERGKVYAKTMPIQLENGHCVYQLYWQRRVLDLISEVLVS